MMMVKFITITCIFLAIVTYTHGQGLASLIGLPGQDTTNNGNGDSGKEKVGRDPVILGKV